MFKGVLVSRLSPSTTDLTSKEKCALKRLYPESVVCGVGALDSDTDARYSMTDPECDGYQGDLPLQASRTSLRQVMCPYSTPIPMAKCDVCEHPHARELAEAYLIEDKIERL